MKFDEYFSDLVGKQVQQALSEFIPLLVSALQGVSEKAHTRYLTRKQTATYLSIGVSTVDYWARIGKLKKIENGTTVRFDKQAIDDAMQSGNLTKYQSRV